MPQDVDSIVIAATGSVYVAPVGTSLPTDINATLNVAFADLGYITEDGATLADSKSKDPVGAWQSRRPLIHTVSETDTRLSLALRQWDRHTVPLAFGGGTITQTPNGWKYNPPAVEFIDERAVVLAWLSDDYKWMWVAPRMMLAEGIETQLVRTAPSDLPLVLSVLGVPGVQEWYMLTNHPGMAAVLS